jgi:hypothetical protein
MSRHRLASLTLALFLGLTATASASDGGRNANDRAWTRWDRLSARQCPSHHVDNLYGAAYPYLYEGFNQSLSASVRRRVEALAAVNRNCAAETVGHSCMLSNYLEAYDRLGLMLAFAANACARTFCEEPSLCSRAPGQ